MELVPALLHSGGLLRYLLQDADECIHGRWDNIPWYLVCNNANKWNERFEQFGSFGGTTPIGTWNNSGAKHPGSAVAYVHEPECFQIDSECLECLEGEDEADASPR